VGRRSELIAAIHALALGAGLIEALGRVAISQAPARLIEIARRI
jgi:hypothetical protein